MERFRIHDYDDIWNSATNVVGGDVNDPFTMIDLANMHQSKIASSPPSQTHYSVFLLVLICFIVFLLIFAVCVMCFSYMRRKIIKKRGELISRSDTSETLIIESTLMNTNNNTMYSAIDV